MILNFPYLHKDEILYSGIARYFDYLNENNIMWVTEHLFNSRVRAVVGLPAGLKNLYDNFPKGSPYTPSYLVNSHSIYPFFRPFIDLPRHEKIMNDMLFKNGKGIMARVGAVASSIPNKRKLYYCASCIKEQMDLQNTEYLDVFWNRVHQCPGVFICHKHREWLKQTTFSLNEISQHIYISLGSLVDSSQLDLSIVPIQENKINDLHTRIAENVEWILNNNLSARDLNYYRYRYIEYLKFKGIAKPSGSVDILRLKEFFLENYPKDFLQQLHSDFDINDEQTWVQLIIQKNRKAFHPIRHILMIMLLAESVSDFFTKEYTYSPFGNGPWDCNNPVCSRQTELISINYSRGCKKEFGDFRCECGFKERRYLSGKSKVLEFGEMWEQELIRLIQGGEGIYSTSRRLNADIATIKKYGEKNNVLDKCLPPIKYNPVMKIQNNASQVNHYEIWLNTIKENTHLNKKEIKALVPTTYLWLYRNDNQFLTENSPTPLPRPKNQKGKVDWAKRDVEMLKTVKLIVENWDRDGNKPLRKTKYTIGKKTQKLHWLDKLPEHFPKTLSYLKSVEESVADFQIRRVKWLLNNDFNKKQVKEWEIYRKAGLRSNIEDKVKTFISDEVMRHNNKVSKMSL